MPSPARPIALVGMPGAGKSAVARAIAARLGVAALDLDAGIEREAGHTIATLFARDGEDAFREREAAALDRALSESAAVIACGGGIVTRAAVRRRLRLSCRVAWLEVSAATAALRLASEAARRPLLAGHDLETRLAELLADRGDAYAEVAHVRVPTDALTVEQTAEAVLRALERATVTTEGAEA
jgi:shikimate kinase